MNRERALELMVGPPRPMKEVLVTVKPDLLHIMDRDLGDIAWSAGNSQVRLDGHFTAEQLEAIVWWMHTGGRDEM